MSTEFCLTENRKETNLLAKLSENRHGTQNTEIAFDDYCQNIFMYYSANWVEDALRVEV